MTPADALPGARQFLGQLKIFCAGIEATAPAVEREKFASAAAVVIAMAEQQLAALERIAPHTEQLAAMPATPTN